MEITPLISVGGQLGYWTDLTHDDWEFHKYYSSTFSR